MATSPNPGFKLRWIVAPVLTITVFIVVFVVVFVVGSELKYNGTPSRDKMLLYTTSHPGLWVREVNTSSHPYTAVTTDNYVVTFTGDYTIIKSNQHVQQ